MDEEELTSATKFRETGASVARFWGVRILINLYTCSGDLLDWHEDRPANRRMKAGQRYHHLKNGWQIEIRCSSFLQL